MGFLQDLKNEFNASNNNTSDLYSQNELFTIDTNNKEHLKIRFGKKGGKLQILDYVALVLGGPFSQIYYRLTRLNGSLDKPWLLFPLFWILPFSAVPTYYISKNKLKKGSAKIKLFNLLGLLPMGGAFLSYMITTMYPDFKFISTLPTLISAMIAFYIKDRKRCRSKKFIKKTKRSLHSAMMMMSISILFHFIVMGLSKVTPVIGPMFEAFYSSPFVGNTIFMFMIYVSFLLTSMIDNTPTIVKFCKNVSNKSLLIVGIITLVLNVIKIVVPSGSSEEGDEDYEEE